MVNGEGNTTSSGSPGGQGPMTGNTASVTAAAVPCRPWLAPTILCVVAALVLLFLLIPGVLRYPVATTVAAAPDPAGIDARRESNQALADRIASLRRLLDAGVCVADGSFQLAPGTAGAPSLLPQDRSALPPPPVERTPVPRPAAGGTGPAAAFSGSLLDLLDQSTVLILQTGADGSVNGSGTGFFVAPGVVLTNQRVTEGSAGRRMFAISRAIGVQRAEIMAESAPGDPGAPDFALLRVGGDGRGQPLAFAPPAERLVSVVAAGFPGMVLQTDERFRNLVQGDGGTPPPASVTEGVVTAVQSGSGTDIVLHTAQITPGNSGGPLIDRCGRVLGINTFIMAREEGRLNYALASADAVRFLRANNIPVQAGTGACNPAAAPVAGAAPPSPSSAQPAAPPAPQGAAGAKRE